MSYRSSLATFLVNRLSSPIGEPTQSRIHLAAHHQLALYKTVLEGWDDAFALLQQLDHSLRTNGAAKTPGIPKEAANLLGPVLYPDNLVAVGGNYAGHLKAMGLEVKKWDAMLV